MNGITPQQLKTLLPLACAWVEEQEQFIIRQGIGLTPSELADAKLAILPVQ
jgi:hypothetical protein